MCLCMKAWQLILSFKLRLSATDHGERWCMSLFSPESVSFWFWTYIYMVGKYDLKCYPSIIIFELIWVCKIKPWYCHIWPYSLCNFSTWRRLMVYEAKTKCMVTNTHVTYLHCEWGCFLSTEGETTYGNYFNYHGISS